MVYQLHDIVKMKKPHPCGTNRWEIIRMGMDIKIRCLQCNRLIMLPRREFEKKLKQVLEHANQNESGNE